MLDGMWLGFVIIVILHILLAAVIQVRYHDPRRVTEQVDMIDISRGLTEERERCAVLLRPKPIRATRPIGAVDGVAHVSGIDGVDAHVTMRCPKSAAALTEMQPRRFDFDGDCEEPSIDGA